MAKYGDRPHIFRRAGKWCVRLCWDIYDPRNQQAVRWAIWRNA